MGEVRAARDLTLGREVAIKLLHHGLAGDERVSRRFEHEAQAAARLTHPNVVRVYDAGNHRGRPFIVMERLDGGTLADEIARGPLSEARVRFVGVQMLEALTAAHRQGVLHRDIKPSNVMIAPDGSVRVPTSASPSPSSPPTAPRPARWSARWGTCPPNASRDPGHGVERLLRGRCRAVRGVVGSAALHTATTPSRCSRGAARRSAVAAAAAPRRRRDASDGDPTRHGRRAARLLRVRCRVRRRVCATRVAGHDRVDRRRTDRKQRWSTPCARPPPALRAPLAPQRRRRCRRPARRRPAAPARVAVATLLLVLARSWRGHRRRRRRSCCATTAPAIARRARRRRRRRRPTRSNRCCATLEAAITP